MEITRRDVLKLAGGSFLGMFFTPMPWKLLDDTAIWTQNWSLIPPLPRGPISRKYSACTLCAAGCALQARCVNGHAFGLTGVPNHPVNNGVLCPAGLAAHHLPYHPLRLKKPCRFSGKKNDSPLVAASLDDVITELTSAIKHASGSVAILDQRPGRMISNVYAGFLAASGKGRYLLPPSRETSTLDELRRMSGVRHELGYDLENTRVILSFGAQLFDGWGTPGRMYSLLKNKKENGLLLIQAETNQSRTALHADVWLPVRPGTEVLLASGIAHVIINEGLYPARVKRSISDFEKFTSYIEPFTPRSVAERTGISPERIVETARTLASNPSVVISGCNPGGGPMEKAAERAIAILNILLDNVGRKGGIVFRNPLPGIARNSITPQSLADVPDNSISVLILDGAESGYALPWTLIERKLVPQEHLVVSLSPYMTQLAAHADILVPSPAQFECVDEVVSPDCAVSASFSVSTPLSKKSGDAVEPVLFIRKLTEAAGFGAARFSSTEEMVQQRARDIHAAQRGFLFSSKEQSTTRLSNIATDDFWTKLIEGGYWIDEECSTKQDLTFRVPEDGIDLNILSSEVNGENLILMPLGWKGTTASATLSPIMSKLFQESNLRDIAGRVRVNPATAASHGLDDGSEACLRTEQGEMNVVVNTDASVMPGVLAAAVGPAPNKSESIEHISGEGVLALCTLAANGTWRCTPATITQM